LYNDRLPEVRLSAIYHLCGALEGVYRSLTHDVVTVPSELSYVCRRAKRGLYHSDKMAEMFDQGLDGLLPNPGDVDRFLELLSLWTSRTGDGVDDIKLQIGMPQAQSPPHAQSPQKEIATVGQTLPSDSHTIARARSSTHPF
jgi:hypothetical protein